MGKHSQRLNQYYFSCMSRRTSYVLGILYQGYSAEGVDGIRFSSKHTCLLEIVKRELSWRNVVVYDPRDDRHNGWIVTVNAGYLRKQLNEFGLADENELRRFPELPDRLVAHFLRGFIEANARIGIENKIPSVEIRYPSLFLGQVVKSLHSYADVSKKDCREKRRVRYAGEDISRIGDFIYADWRYIEKEGLYHLEKHMNFSQMDGWMAPVNITTERANERMKIAAELLEAGLSTPSIAGQLGYSQLPSFYRFFKHVSGMTIRQYRREHGLPSVVHWSKEDRQEF